MKTRKGREGAARTAYTVETKDGSILCADGEWRKPRFVGPSAYGARVYRSGRAAEQIAAQYGARVIPIAHHAAPGREAQPAPVFAPSPKGPCYCALDMDGRVPLCLPHERLFLAAPDLLAALLAIADGLDRAKNDGMGGVIINATGRDANRERILAAIAKAEGR